MIARFCQMRQEFHASCNDNEGIYHERVTSLDGTSRLFSISGPDEVEDGVGSETEESAIDFESDQVEADGAKTSLSDSP